MSEMDLTPGYREFPPPEKVSGVVACLWIRVFEQEDQVRVLPDAASDVVWKRGEGTTVVGPDTGAKLVEGADGDVLIGMRFHPGAGGGALGVPLDLLRDLRVDASEVNRAFSLSGDLAPDQVLAQLVSAAEGRSRDRLVELAALRVGQRHVGALARELSISERQLRRRFRAAAGYGPVTLARVVRFQRFVAAVDAGRDDLAALAFEAGYADQAHLTRETRRLAGLTPGALVRDRRR